MQRFLGFITGIPTWWTSCLCRWLVGVGNEFKLYVWEEFDICVLARTIRADSQRCHSNLDGGLDFLPTGVCAIHYKDLSPPSSVFVSY